MPLVLEYEPDVHRPTKRQRRVQDVNMTRRPDPEDENPQLQEHHNDPRLEGGCEIPPPADRRFPSTHSEIHTSNREELIQCIKRGQRPMWVPKPGLQALYAEEQELQDKRSAQRDPDTPVSPTSANFQFEHDLLFGPWNNSNDPIEQPRALIPSAGFDREVTATNSDVPNEDVGARYSKYEAHPTLRSSPPSWLEESSYPIIGQAVSESQTPSTVAPLRRNRPRAPSLSSSFVMRVPTSPLVHAVNNPNLDFSARSENSTIDVAERKSRRRTMPPHSFQSYSSASLEATTPNFSRPLPHPVQHREPTSPSQVHQTRKSIGSFTLHSSPGFQTPRSPGRRLSLAMEGSPLRRTSMVGSFEESILRGRMSSPASKPFDFIAQIGVMGKGNCPASLKCPAHVSLPFQAVFYNYPSSQNLRSIADDAPSPYVGTVDIENNLKPVQLASKKKRASTIGTVDTEFYSDSDPRAPENTAIGRALARDAQLQQQQQQQSDSPEQITRTNIGGAYRVPQQGQLQIIIKTSNKTAVKLFLVPYDLEGMEPGMKTFIRQRNYSCGPIVEGALSDRSQQPDVFDPLKNKSILRYLIHIKFCCPSKGKYYLYDNIRVVFANRVPDGKEKLQYDVQLPEPKYSPWKPVMTTENITSASRIGPPSTTKSSRHGSSPALFDDLPTLRLRERPSVQTDASPIERPVPPSQISYTSDRKISSHAHILGESKLPFVFPDVPVREELSRKPEPAISAVQGFFASTSPRSSPIPWGSSSSSTVRSFSPVPVEAGSGLLSQQFKGLQNLSVGTGAESSSTPWPSHTNFTRVLSQGDATVGEGWEDESVTQGVVLGRSTHTQLTRVLSQDDAPKKKEVEAERETEKFVLGGLL